MTQQEKEQKWIGKAYGYEENDNIGTSDTEQ